MLAAMKRGHTVLEYKQKLRKLRAVRPDISISTDIIVGFPGETDEDFAATLKLIEEVGFDQSFSFLYSRRPGTPAASLARRGAAGGEAAPARARPAALQYPGAGDFASAWSEAASVCWSSGPPSATRTSSPAAPTTIAGSILHGPATLINQFADVVITEARPNSLRGRLVVEIGA